MIACKKEQPFIETPLSTWEDSQKVRILKVELNKIFTTSPFNGDTSLFVEYIYNSNEELYQILLKRNSLSSDVQIQLVTITDQSFNIEYNFPSCLGYEWKFINNSIQMKDNRIYKVSGNYNQCIFGMPQLNTLNRISNFSYDKNGLLEKIQSNMSTSLRNGTEINITSYDENQLKSYQVASYTSVFSDKSIESENYKVDVKYKEAKEVPDGLIRMINQALLGINSIGFEDFNIIPEFQDISYISIDFPEASGSVMIDWAVSFGSSKIQTLPAQNSIVSSKRIYGKRVASLNEEEGELYNYVQVDSTANFPYIYDAFAKTLEIAGLKIYYELVE